MKIRELFLAAAVTVVSVVPALSATMYVHDFAGNLGTVDTDTGAASVIGNMGATMTDIAFDSTGHLYGVTFSSLYSIDAGTGTSTLIGSHGIPLGNSLVFGTDGTLYGAGLGNNLYTIDTTTGAGTSLGSMGHGAAGELAFSNGTLYMASSFNELVKIDLSDLSNSSVVGDFGVSDMYGLATAGDGTMYGLAGTTIYEINIATGEAINGVSFAGQGLGEAYGQSFYGEAAPVPLPASGLLLLGGFSALGAAASRRRRNARAAQLGG